MRFPGPCGTDKSKISMGVVHSALANGRVCGANRPIEKPTDDYAEEYLGVRNARGEQKYYATFGQYVLTSEVFDELEREISSGTPSEGQEYGLTAALDRVRKRDGLYGFAPSGRSFDISLPETYRKTMWHYFR